MHENKLGNHIYAYNLSGIILSLKTFDRIVFFIIQNILSTFFVSDKLYNIFYQPLNFEIYNERRIRRELF